VLQVSFRLWKKT